MNGTPSPPRLPDFDMPDLARAVEALPRDRVDALPYGAILVDRQGIVRLYNATERRLSGAGEQPRLDLGFFANVAPCMNTPGVRDRITHALEVGRFDIEFGWVGDSACARRGMRARVQPAAEGGCWIFLAREAD